MLNAQLTNGRILHITPGRVNLPVVEEISDENFLDTTIFGTQYKQMLASLDSYVRYNRNGLTLGDIHRTDSPNNVFTFVGERGSGKTSCMSSVSKLLTNGKIASFSQYKNLCSAQFATIDIIDPSYFDEEHNIIAMMVATLYKVFSEYDKSIQSNFFNRDYRNDLIDAFVHTQRSMRCLLEEPKNQSVYDDDDIENLSDLSMAIKLKTDIYNLVQLFLKYVKKDNGFLVLSIDDIDLNVAEADTMAEQIRKYLVCPNIIILLAAKLDQLALIKKLHYAKEFDTLLQKERMDYGTIEDMTSQFLAKFAPHDHRVYMPNMEVYLKSGIEIDGNKWYGDSVLQVVPELIFNRTRYLFYSSKQTPSYIIPRNLRKLCQLVSMLWGMETYHNASQDANKEIFRNYLFGTWVQDNLCREDRLFADKVLEGWKNEQLNRIALDVIKEKYRSWIDKIISELDNNNLIRTDLNGELKALYDERNREYNLSVGDVLSLIDALEVPFESHSDKCFFFFIKTIYSMALYESYNSITDKQDEESSSQETEAQEDENNRVLLYDPFSDEKIDAYYKLVGGRFYNYRLSPVLAKENFSGSNNDQVSRSDRMINYTVLENEMIKIIEKWSDRDEKIGQTSENYDEEFKLSVRLCEFFMLCSSRDINLRHSNRKESDYYDHSFRQNDNVYYNGEFAGKDRLYFDLGAFFFNITRMDECYNRFKDTGKKFCQLCKDDTKSISLYSVFHNRACYYREGYSKSHAWQSWASIRNAEIMFDLHRFLRSKCRLKIAGNQKHLETFFKVLSEYAIKTYDRDDKGTKLIINFNFASEIADLLGHNAISGAFENVFSAYKKSISSNSTTSSGINSSEFPRIDVEKFVKRRRSSGNMKDSIKRSLLRSECCKIAGFESLVEEALGQYGEMLTKEEIIKVCNNLNNLLRRKYGTS